MVTKLKYEKWGVCRNCTSQGYVIGDANGCRCDGTVMVENRGTGCDMESIFHMQNGRRIDAEESAGAKAKTGSPDIGTKGTESKMILLTEYVQSL